MNSRLEEQGVNETGEDSVCAAALRAFYNAPQRERSNGEIILTSHPELVEGADRLEIRSPMRVGMRVLLAALGFFPLLAPYELLIRIDWEHYVNPFFFLAAFISAGATALSAFLFLAVIAGLSSTIFFDRRTATFSYSSEAPVVGRTRRVHPLSDVRSIEVGVRDWSDSAPTYHLGVTMNDGTVFESGSSWSRDEIESIRGRVDQFLAAAAELRRSDR